jgi:hypothetical protein
LFRRRKWGRFPLVDQQWQFSSITDWPAERSNDPSPQALTPTSIVADGPMRTSPNGIESMGRCREKPLRRRHFQTKVSTGGGQKAPYPSANFSDLFEWLKFENFFRNWEYCRKLDRNSQTSPARIVALSNPAPQMSA